MGILDKLFGTEPEASRFDPARSPSSSTAPPRDPDAQAVERYRYLLRTAPPDAIEEAHTEAFARLSPDQRKQVLEQMSQGVSLVERPASDDPQALARAATRAELQRPGFMERTFGGHAPGALASGTGLGGTLFATIAGSFIGSSIAHSLFGGMMAEGVADAGNDEFSDAGSQDADVAMDTDGGGDFDAGFGDGFDGFDV
ncbi:hypothetical protein [Chondromyces crocatus]|uniref:DUF2076 domain-containing protein n=1 Tax=Chondromyces crocatus TaxID=52 RepID=A0A0K1E602_CHOCO|nr:hypothetical protein [Chondromyces crocatus]AKT36102.1 uncharacterized protein CMC5_002150 [Chondromyces crocatus]